MSRVPDRPEVTAERVATAMRQSPTAVTISTAVAGLLVLVMDRAGHGGMLLWFAAMAALSAARLVAWRIYARSPSAARRTRLWAVICAGGATASGVLWGLGVILLWPEDPADRLYWVFVIGGMCAGAAMLHFPHPPTALGFALPAGVPIALLFAAAGNLRGAAAAVMIMVFIAAMVFTCLRSSRQFGNYVLLQLQEADHARALDHANARLRREMEDRRATEETLRQAQKMEAVGQLTGGIAHDFNNLLMAVLGNLALLRKRLPVGDGRAARLLDAASEGAERGAALTQRLLAFSRRQALRPEPYALPALVDGMTLLLERSVGPAHEIALRFPPDLPPVLVDGNQLELALLNLVLNARDAMAEGGAIVIAAEARTADAEAVGLAPGRYVVLSVTDTGIGMDPATLARATEPFFTTKGVGRGTGLGLAMVHGLAGQSGGRLALRSTPGQGTVAELWLPQAPVPEAALVVPVAPAGADPSGLRHTVLVVDDDPLVLASTAAMIEELGHVPIEAPDGATALTRLRGRPGVDLLLTDYGMPGMNGLELAEAARGIRPALPVLVATGYGDLPQLEAAGLPRLSKPYDQAALAAAMTTVLDGGRAPRPEGATQAG